MQFQTLKKETIIINPAKNNERKSIPSEIRKDPLTGRTARICHFMKSDPGNTGYRRLAQPVQRNPVHGLSGRDKQPVEREILEIFTHWSHPNFTICALRRILKKS